MFCHFDIDETCGGVSHDMRRRDGIPQRRIWPRMVHHAARWLNAPSAASGANTAPSRSATYWDRLPSWFGLAVALALYLVALNIWRDRVPVGLNNDVAEEALRGVYLVEGGRLEAINLRGVTSVGYAFGNSMETLFLYVLGLAARLLGSSMLAIHVSTWLFALGSIVLLCLLTQRIEPGLPTWVPLLLAMTSVWLFHYARSGLRAITAPLFLLAFTLLLDRTERSDPRWVNGLSCGAVLGLSLYSYTSCRVLPLAFVVHALVRLWSNDGKRRDLLRRYGAVLTGALITSIPNLLLLLREPDAFLLRGAYVVRGGLLVKALNILWTLLLPFHYPQYKTAVGPTHVFDGVSIALTVAGLRPVHPIVGMAILIGLARAWIRRGQPTVSFMLSAWITGTVVLGISGPSLTRMLFLLPFYLMVAALGLGAALRFRGAAPVIGIVLLLLGVDQAREYFVTFAQNPRSQQEYHPVATAIGQRARVLAADGTRVMCVVTANLNVVNYLTHDFQERVSALEYWTRPTDTHEIPLMLRLQPQVILLERDPGLDLFRATFLLMGSVEPRSGFDEISLDPRLSSLRVP